MAATNSFKGKYNEGTFANGQGPIHGLSIKIEQENKGLINPASPQRHLTTVGGKGGDGLNSRSEEKGFDIYSSSYKGPQNFKPDNKGEVPNYAINSSK